MSETEVKTDAPTAEEIKGTKRAAEVRKLTKNILSNGSRIIFPPDLATIEYYWRIFKHQSKL